MFKRYDVLTDIGVKLFESNSVTGIQNFLTFFDKSYETKKVNKSSDISEPAKVRLEKLRDEFDTKKIVNGVSELNDEYRQMNTIPKSYAKGLMALATLAASGSLESVGDKSLFASVSGNNTFTKAYINKLQLSKLN
jgi:hypothetical protein